MKSFYCMGCTLFTFCFWHTSPVLLYPVARTSPINLMFLLPHRHVLIRPRAFIAHRLRVFHANAPVLSLPGPPALSHLENKASIVSALEWLNAFRNAKVPRQLVELSFARSSGPGGQVPASLFQSVVTAHALTFEIRRSTER